MDQIKHRHNPVVLRTSAAYQVVAALKSRAEFEILQLRRFEENIPFIESSLRANILRNIHESFDWTRGCIYVYKNFSQEIPRLMGRMLRIRNFDIDVSVPEIHQIPDSTEEEDEYA